MNPGNVAAVLSRAAIKNETPEWGNVAAAVFRAAKGKGKVLELVAVKDGEQITHQPFDDGDMQAWAAHQPDDVQIARSVAVA